MIARRRSPRWVGIYRLINSGDEDDEKDEPTRFFSCSRDISRDEFVELFSRHPDYAGYELVRVSDGPVRCGGSGAIVWSWGFDVDPREGRVL